MKGQHARLKFWHEENAFVGQDDKGHVYDRHGMWLAEMVRKR
jgi:hypothetical protein